MTRKVKEYAVYKGDEFIDLGTAKNMAKKLEVKPDTIRFMASKVNLKRFNEGAGNRYIAVVLD